MPTKPTQIFVQFPTFDGQSEEMKSLINFFMEGASVFFHGFYDDLSFPSKMTSYTGEVRFNNRPLFDDSTHGVEYTPYELVIPYQNFFTTNFPALLLEGATSTAPQANLSSYTSDLPYLNDSPVVTEGITDYTVASLTSVKTAMNLCMGGSASDGGSGYVPTSSFVSTNTISLPVQVIPMINDVANENVKLKPKQIATHVANDDNLYIQKITIEDILDSSGNPIEEGFVYDFQLRTESFGLKDESLLGASVEEVFYKVGITRLDTNVSMDTILSVLKTASLTLENITPGTGVAYVRFSLSDSSDHSSSPSYRLCPDVNTIEQHIGTGNINGIATRAIMALQDGTYAIKALIYIKLYKANGSEYTNLIADGHYSLYDMEDTTSSVDLLYLDLTDQNLD